MWRRCAHGRTGAWHRCADVCMGTSAAYGAQNHMGFHAFPLRSNGFPPPRRNFAPPRRNFAPPRRNFAAPTRPRFTWILIHFHQDSMDFHPRGATLHHRGATSHPRDATLQSLRSPNSHGFPCICINILWISTTAAQFCTPAAQLCSPYGPQIHIDFHTFPSTSTILPS